MARVRILVLTSSTGGGHDARAEAFAEWCYHLYRHDVDVRIEQMLEKSSVINRLGVNSYNWIQRTVPVLHKAFYAVVELLSVLNRRTVTLGRSYYLRVLKTYRPHLVFSVHDCLNRGYFPLARRTLGSERVRCATYCGEFSGGWGYSVNWIEPSVDLYFSRTPTARDYAVKKGLPPERARVRGHLMRPRAHVDWLSPAERAALRVRRLGLRPDLFTVFLATGSNGANRHLELLPVLAHYADRCQAIAICGRNRDAYNQVLHWRSEHPELNLFVEGYSDQVHRLMQVSDLIVTRGGTTTCAQALHFRCPIVFDAFDGIMPQERLTWKFFHQGAGSARIARADDLATLLADWLSDPRAYEVYRDRFLALRYEEDPTVLIEELVGLAQEAAGVSLTRRPFPPVNGQLRP